jgi:hypothetical protein
VLRRLKYDRALIPQVDENSRFRLQLMRKLRIHARAGDCQVLHGARGFGTTIHQHSARGVRGFAARLPFINHKNAGALLAEFERQREADDACANYDYVPILHTRIVRESREATRVGGQSEVAFALAAESERPVELKLCVDELREGFTTSA